MKRTPAVIDKNGTGSKINSFMKKQNLQPRDIQYYLGLTCVQTVYRWLDGINIPTVDNLYALSQLFDINVDEMLAGNRKRKPGMYLWRMKYRIILYEETFYETI